MGIGFEGQIVVDGKAANRQAILFSFERLVRLPIGVEYLQGGKRGKGFHWTPPHVEGMLSAIGDAAPFHHVKPTACG